MCGIVGLLGTHGTNEKFAERRQLAMKAVKTVEELLEEMTAEELSKWLEPLSAWIKPLPCFDSAFRLGSEPEFVEDVRQTIDALKLVLAKIGQEQEKAEGFKALENWNQLGIECKDLLWRLEKDLLSSIDEILHLFPQPWKEEERHIIQAYWEIEFVLRGLQRLEIRGRDSGGISIQVAFPTVEAYRAYLEEMKASEDAQEWKDRQNIVSLLNGSICGPTVPSASNRSLSFVYKVASEVGRIGDNIKKLRQRIYADKILRKAISTQGTTIYPLSHTRWASNGIINVPNTHPQGDDVKGMLASDTKLFAVLNGDIDNYAELLDAYERRTGNTLPPHVTTDAKIIPLLIEERYQSIGDLREAFRQVLTEFRGSFAIVIQHLEYPDQCWLGIGGSGQSLYVGVHENAVYFASELYGVVEGTSRFIKLDGEKERVAGLASTRGQMLEIDRRRIGSDIPFQAWSFDGTQLNEEQLKLSEAQITTRDINIDDYPHFFLKEITESVESVRKTLHGRFFLKKDNPDKSFLFNLGEAAVPTDILDALKKGRIEHIYCIGQGTAAIAGTGVANALEKFFPKSFDIRATKATELSGHMLSENMEDTLVIAVSQSGTTTDTNRTVDLVRQRGAKVLAILNRRHSDLAFKADGVIFTSDGRDVEMSVASTKAFYSQVTAGALLSLYLAHELGYIQPDEVQHWLQELLALPEKMKQVFTQKEKIKKVAHRYALAKRYWAVVGSGFNQIAAHEIRIKLSELCYKSMSCDYIEDKKHIDLSAEPLMLVCAAGLDESNLSDSVKEVAIFKAHNSIPIVIASRGADRFEPYAAAVFEVPDAPPQLSPILTTIVGHLFGYYAAGAIDSKSMYLRTIRSTLLENMDALENDPETLLAPHNPSELREKLQGLLQALQTEAFNTALEPHTAVRVALLTQKLLTSFYETSVYPSYHDLDAVDSFNADQMEAKDSPFELAQRLLQALSIAILELSRPIDAIKHQAKTVTVGISRPSPKLKGVVGAVFQELELSVNSVLWRHLSYLIAAEPLIKEVRGATLYRIEGLDSEGIPTEHSRIYKEDAIGIAANLPSRAETDHTLKGSKWLVLKNNALMIGIGRQDKRHIALIPLRGAAPKQSQLLLLHLAYNEEASLQDRLQLLRARGAIFDQFKASVTELNMPWSDELLLKASVASLFADTPDQFIASITA